MLDAELEVATGDDMAKKSADRMTVETYVRELRSAARDRPSFDRVLQSLKLDKRVGAAEAIAIAAQYAGKKFDTKKAALEGVAKRFVDLVRTSARLEIAAKERIM